MAGVTASADLVESGAISGKMLKDLYDLSFERGQDFPAVYDEEGTAGAVARHVGAGETCRRVDRRESEAGGAISRRQEDDAWVLRGPSDEELRRARRIRNW